MHSEHVARTTWCPMIARVLTTNHPELPLLVANDNGEQRVGNCIASACAMWRWAEEKTRAERTTASVTAQSTRRGYCGLAGKPSFLP